MYLFRPTPTVGLEVIPTLLPEPARDPVARDDQVGIRQLAEILDLVLEPDVHAETERPRGQDFEEAPAADSVPVARDVDRRPALDGEELTVPAKRVGADLPGGLGVAGAELVDEVVPEHNAPPVGHSTRVAFEDGELVVPVPPHQDREVQAGGPATDAHSHGALLLSFVDSVDAHWH
jgi:hypothetical protein